MNVATLSLIVAGITERCGTNATAWLPFWPDCPAWGCISLQPESCPKPPLILGIQKRVSLSARVWSGKDCCSVQPGGHRLCQGQAPSHKSPCHHLNCWQKWWTPVMCTHEAHRGMQWSASLDRTHLRHGSTRFDRWFPCQLGCDGRGVFYLNGRNEMNHLGLILKNPTKLSKSCRMACKEGLDFWTIIATKCEIPSATISETLMM